MNNRILSKILATILVLLFTFSNVVLLGVYATSGELEQQGTSVNHAEMEFDAYFKKDQTKIHSMITDINTQDIKLYINVKVREGSLNHASVQLSNSNFILKQYQDENGMIQNIDSENNILYFNQLNKGTDVVLEIPIQVKKETKIDVDYFTKESKLLLTGSYLNKAGEEKTIEKEIKVVLELNGKEEITLEQKIDKYVIYDETEKGIILQSTVTAQIVNHNLPVKEKKITIKVPTIYEYKPQKVVVVGEESNYDKDSGILTIYDKNEIKDNQIEWNKENETYKIIYLYEQGTKDTITTEGVNIQQTVEAKIEAYNNEKTENKAISQGNVTLKEQISDNVSYQIRTDIQEIYKGFLYHNSQYETEYQTTWVSDIGYSSIVNEIKMQSKEDQYITTTGEMLNSNSYYKTTKISKSNFERILGIDGEITILNREGKEIGKINQQAQVDEQGNFVFTYDTENKVKEITLITTKPLQDTMGEELIVFHNKSIISRNQYSKEQVKDLQVLKTSVNELNKEISLKEVETKTELSFNTNTIATAVSNNVQFAVTFRTDSAKYQLYQNPVIDITLPNYVETIEILDSNILFDNEEFKINHQEVITDVNGNKIIRVILSGNQTDYILNSTTKGINLFINTMITTNKYMASQEASIIMTCKNQKDNTMSISSIPMKFESETGILMTNSILNYTDHEQKTSFRNDVQIGQLVMNTQEKIATMKMDLINNYNKDIKGAVVLGRIPFKDNQTILNSKKLGSTFDTLLQSAIQASGISATIYYSENPQASKELDKKENQWTTDVSEHTKSYLIVFNEDLKKGSTISFSYDIKIPANLGVNEQTYSTYAIYCENNVFEATAVGMATKMTVSNENINQMIEQANQNVNATNQKVTNIGEEKLQVTSKYYNQYSAEEKITPNTEFSYVITIKNISYEKIKYLDITDYLSDKVQYLSSNATISEQLEDYGGNNISIHYDENQKKLLCQVNELDAGATINLQIDVKAKEYVSNGIINNITVMADEIQIYKNNTIPMKKPADITAKIGSITQEYIKEGQEINYTVTIKNSGEAGAGLNILDQLPEGLTLVNASYRIDNTKVEIEETTYRTVEIPYVFLAGNQTITINITAKAEELPEDMEEREINNFATITGEGINIITDTIKHTIRTLNTDNPDNPVINQYRINGTIWIDKDLNGRRDEQEQVLSDVKVKLLNDKNEVVKETTTNSEGKYEFNELSSGNYIVMFEYDSKLYGVTTYQKEGVLDNLNSDAKETTIGDNKVAITDVIKINKSSITNMDLGLVKNSLFDLKLDKYINSLTVQNNQGIKTYSYVESHFEKIELVAKDLSSTNVIFEYRIVVTNEGDVPGYVKQIVDYMPKDLKFNSELNADWYLNTGGYLYNSSLTNEIIQPGETKEVTLVLTKQMNENNTGLVTNDAEIASHYNEQGLSDYDSIPANQNQSEDDISTAHVVLGIKTGGVTLYLTITFICIVIMAGGIYLINKKVIRGMK